MKWLAIALAGILVLGTVMVAFAGPRSWAPSKPYFGYGTLYQQRFWKGDLTPEQTEKLQSLMKSYGEKTASLRNELQLKMAELRVLILQSQPSADEIKGKLEEINNLRTQIQKMAVDMLLEAKKIIPPEQLPRWLGGGFFFRDKRTFPQRGYHCPWR